MVTAKEICEWGAAHGIHPISPPPATDLMPSPIVAVACDIYERVIAHEDVPEDIKECAEKCLACMPTPPEEE